MQLNKINKLNHLLYLIKIEKEKILLMNKLEKLLIFILEKEIGILVITWKNKNLKKRNPISYKRKISSLVGHYLKEQRKLDKELKENDEIVMMAEKKSVTIGILNMKIKQ
jgi:hypothetical protein